MNFSGGSWGRRSLRGRKRKRVRKPSQVGVAVRLSGRGWRDSDGYERRSGKGTMARVTEWLRQRKGVEDHSGFSRAEWGKVVSVSEITDQGSQFGREVKMAHFWTSYV